MAHWSGRAAIAWMLGAAAGARAAPPPDLSGIWGAYLEPGQSILSTFKFAPPALALTDEGRRRHEEYRQLLGPENANPAAYCVDYGMPMMMEQIGAYPVEIIQQPEQITLIYEVEGELRRIYLGTRGVPADKRLPTRQGYSRGHWQGDTLTVETTDLADGQDQTHPHSDQARISERFHLGRSPKGTRVIDYEMTLTDPVYYTGPVKVTRRWEAMPQGYIITYRCTDEFWAALLEARRAQWRAGKPVSARMSDIYKERESRE